jgi:hypothetical protein
VARGIRLPDLLVVEVYVRVTNVTEVGYDVVADCLMSKLKITTIARAEKAQKEARIVKKQSRVKVKAVPPPTKKQRQWDWS